MLVKPDLSASCRPSIRTRGFALVVTLSLLVLLSVIAVGLLSLSSVTLRSSAHASSKEQARANARLALMLALGRVQSLAGPDTRITAPRIPEDPAAELNSVPPAYGVWRSWEGTNHDLTGSSAGRPKAPDYDSKKSGADEGGRFLGWLVSTADGVTPDPAKIPDLKSDAATGLVPLVSSGSVTDPKRRVFLKPTLASDTNATKGALGWWVGGENCKAHVAPDVKPTANDSTVAWQERARAHAVASPKAFGLSGPPDMALPSSGSLSLAATDAKKAKGNFHDVTVWASGLLTNAATGGWKRDLSLMTEKYEELPATDLPFFTLKPGGQQRFSKAAPPQTAPGAHPNNPLLYWWCTYPNSPSSIDTRRQVPAIASWDYLRNACIQYRSLITLNASAGRTAIPTAIASWWKNGGKDFRYEFIDQPRRWPALSRIYLMLSYTAVPDTANPANLKAALVMAPVIVLWNPYSHQITIDGSKKFNVNTVNNQITPARFAFTIGTARQNPISLYEIMGTNVDFRLNGGIGAEALTLGPGESRVFSVRDDVLVDGASVSGGQKTLNLYPGYRTNGGFYFLKIGTGRTEVSAPENSEFKVDLSFDAKIDYEGKVGYGSMLDVGFVDVADPNNGFNRRSGRQYLLFSQTAAASLWPPIPASQLPTSKLFEVQGGKTKLFLTTVIGFRTANDSMIPGKGYLQTNPLNSFSDLANANMVGIGNLSGIQHPANSCYDIQFINGADVSARPNCEPNTNRGYVVSGLDASSGLTSCVSAEIPTRPLQSLGELQHLDLRNCNPFPPFQFNIFGNSQASPMLPADSVVISPMQHDDAYCLNHAFFDDWFVSSIAPDMEDWTRQPERGLDAVYKDFLRHSLDPKSGFPLPNKMFRPTPDAMSPNPDKAHERDVKPADSYLTIASKLTVEGMFNVNSTSVTAWRALLGHALGQRQPYLTGNGGNWQVELAPERDHVVSRMSVAGGGAAGIDPAPPGAFAEALEFSGHRALTDGQLDALAGEVVRQIRLRGPFLSLSEFVNRRLTAKQSEQELALGGAVQMALERLANSGSDNPFRELKLNARPITNGDINAIPAIAEANYRFPEAALGSAANALPGWIRQADIMRPIAPVLSVRDDTFVIRAYGDARDSQGNITATAWCEAIIQRNPEFVDSSDPATDTPVLGSDSSSEKFLQSAANERFGRRFTIVSFRWLNAAEV